MISNIYNFFSYLFFSFASAGALNPNNQNSPNVVSQFSKTASSCLSNTGNFITFKFDTKDVYLIFIQMLVIVAASAGLAGAITKDSGATWIVFIIGSLSAIWITLSLFAAPTFGIIPNPWGGSLYAIITLGFTIGCIDQFGGLKT